MNQCEHIYSEFGLGKHVDRTIYVIESRIESSSERDQNQLEMWRKDKQYHVSEMPFDENMAESIKVAELKRYGLYSYISFMLHRSTIEMGWIDANFFRG